VKRPAPESLPLARLVKRTEVRATSSSGGDNRSRQPVTGGLEVPQPAALARQAARRAPSREPDLATWQRLTPAQRRQPKWRALAGEWQRAAAVKAGLLTALAGRARPQGLSLSVDEARRLLGAEPDAAAPLIGALLPGADRLPVTTGLFAPRTDDAETPPPRGET
jgi:hypothetical protein